MPEQTPRRRPHPCLLISRTVRVLRSAWIVIGLGVGLSTVLPPGWRTAFVVLAAYYGYTRCVQVFYDYVAIRYSAGARGIVVIRGIIGREEKRFTWDSVVSVSATQTVFQRFLRIADLRVDLDASHIASETLPGISAREVARLVRLHSQKGSTPPERLSLAQSAPEPSSSRTITPVLSALDFLLIGIYSGAFVLFVPSAYTVAAELSPWLGTPRTVLPTLHDLASLDAGALGVYALAAVALSVGYGTGVAWIRYRRFSVALRPSGDLVFMAGLSSREQRVIGSDAVAAYELRRPLLMFPARRASLRAVVRGDGGRVTRGMLLPLTRVVEGRQMLSTLTGLSGEVLRDGIRRSPGLIATSVLSGLGLCAAVAVGASFSAGSALVNASIALLLFRAVDVRIGCIRVASTGAGVRWIVVQRGVVFRSTWTISAAAVDVSRWTGVDHRHGTHTLSIRGRRSLRLAVWPTSARRAFLFRRAVDTSTALAPERNTR